MFCLDGNNSLKRIAPTAKHQQGDMRVLEDSDYYLSRDYVDRFAGEVKSRPSWSKDGADAQICEHMAFAAYPPFDGTLQRYYKL